MVKKKIFLSFVTLKKGTKKIRQSSHKKIQEKIPNPKMTFEKLVFEAQYPVPKKGAPTDPVLIYFYAYTRKS